MEVAILSALVGLGYLFNENNENNDPVNTSIKNDASTPNGDNIYNMRVAGIQPTTNYIFSYWVAWNSPFNGSLK